MRKKAAASILMLLVSAAGVSADVASTSKSPSAQKEPALVVEEKAWSFGDVYQGSVVAHRFAVRNQGAVPLTIRLIEPDPGRNVLLPIVLLPGARTEIPFRVNVGTSLGKTSISFALLSDDPVRGGVRKLRLTGFVQSAYKPELPSLDFGSIDRRQGKQQGFDLTSQEVDRLEILEVTGAPIYLVVEYSRNESLTDEAYRVRVGFRPNAPAGFQSGTIRIRTNVQAQPEYVIGYSGNVFGDVVPSANPVWFGALKIGDEAVKSVLLTSRTRTPFKIARVENPWSPLTVQEGPCPERRDDLSCRSLTLRVRVEPGLVLDGLLRIFVAETDEMIPISYRGIVLPPGAKIVEGEIGSSPAKNEQAPEP